MNSLNSTELMPVLFFGHGSPMNAIEENEFVSGWRNIGKTLPEVKAIICISAHWETQGTYVTAADYPPTIHDFGGFPDELFRVRYPAPGSRELALAIKNLITKTETGINEKRGLDHGCWSVVKHLFPEANIPVVQLSMDYTRDALYHYKLAKELFPLRQKGIIIIGSGNIVHNLRMLAWDRLNESGFGFDWAIEANEKMKKFILEDNHKQLVDYKSQGKEFDLAIPTPEHYLPLLYVLSLKENNEKIELFNDKPIADSLTMTSLKIS